MKSHKKIVVTGASGLIGTEVCKFLDLKGVDFVALTMNNPALVKYGVNIRMDLRQVSAIDEILLLKPTHIIHCAAMIPGISGFSDEEIFNVNLQIDRNILDICSRLKSRLTYISSTSVYGFPLVKEVTESTPVPEELPLYSQGKLLSEREIAESQIDARILRVNAPYGSRQSTRTVLQVFIEKAMKGEDISYYGSGSRQQDFTYSGDIARMIVDSLDASAQGIFNISANQPISMKSLAKLVVNQVPGCKSDVLEAGIRDAQEGHLALYNTQLAREVLGWNPTTDLKRGINMWIKDLGNEVGSIL